jgi:hypothetical protein
MKIIKHPAIKIFIYPMTISLSKLTKEPLECIIARHLFPNLGLTIFTAAIPPETS